MSVRPGGRSGFRGKLLYGDIDNWLLFGARGKLRYRVIDWFDGLGLNLGSGTLPQSGDGKENGTEWKLGLYD